MVSSDLISAIQRNEKVAIRKLFQLYYGRLAAISARYAKSTVQADEMFNHAFYACYDKIQKHNFISESETDTFIEKEFVSECISFVKNIRSEYYVSSTVHPTAHTDSKNYNLFDNNEVIDFNNVETDVMVKGLQKLVPAQRLVFNLHVVEGFPLVDVAAKLESSEETVKSNLEKARFNFQRNIEKDLKSNQML